MIDTISSLLLNALPLIILVIPIPFIWKKIIGKIYFRIVVGIVVFYLIYWVLPIIFQLRIQPRELSGGNTTLGIGFIIVHFLNLLTIFASYPLITLPFIFCTAPFFSFIIVWYKLKREEGSIKENIHLITYEYKESPLEKIKNELLKNDWSREKELFKLMLIFLPISLYLLQVVLEISNLQYFSLATAETALGWFLEILFVYMAVFLFSIELLFSSQVAIKGRYFGEKIREQTYRSLTTVGIPISILSIILFIVQYFESIDIIAYFFAYFIMGAIIFVLFFKIFEPISVLIFIKLMDWWKSRKENIAKLDKTNYFYGIVFGLIAVFIYSIISVLLGYAYVPLFGADPQAIITTGRFNYPNPTLIDSFLFDLMIIINTIILDFLPIIITTILIYYTLKYIKSVFIGLISFLPQIIIISIIFSIFLNIFYINPMIKFTPQEYWLTGQTSFFSIFGINYFTLRTAAFEANLTGLLGVLATPYLYTRYIFNIIFWGIFIFYLLKQFKIKNIPIDDKSIQRIMFSKLSDYIPYKDYSEGEINYLISKNKRIVVEGLEQQREEVKSLLNTLEQDYFLKDLIPEDKEEKKRFYFTLKYLFTNKQINLWKPESSFRFERVRKQGLYVIYEDGRGICDHAFVKEGLQDPGIISGMFSAITSFIKETTKSQQFLKTIDHGDFIVVVEYGSNFFGALFVKGAQTSEVRVQLKEFVEKFENKYSKALIDWSGALDPFNDVDKLVEDIFKEE